MLSKQNNTTMSSEVVSREQYKRIRREYFKEINDYKSSLKHHIVTSRFNMQTLQENRDFVEKTPTIKCIYCCPDPIAKTIPIDSVLFVLEMNNETNKIAGIGLVRNHAFMHKYNVYSERSYNRYIYYGKNHIARENMTEEEDRIMKVFDILCFTGSKHMKRGQGIKSFPIETLYKCKRTLDLVGFIAEMFKIRMSKKDSNT
uniref:Uncharacterized protein n=1 Tax=viral metagenome TaxID=1070528 RepID=A0A6C0K2B8_9ZZZZ